MSLPAISSSIAPLEETRERLIVWLEVAIALIGGLLCAAVTWRLLADAPKTGGRLVQTLAGLIPFSDTVGKVLGGGIAESVAAPIVAFLAGGWLCWNARRLVRWIVDHLFPPLDTDLLRPIGPPGSLDPLWLPPIGTDRGMQPLPWVPPSLDSPRRSVWDTLIAFLSREIGDGRFDLLGHPATPFVRFRWIVLTGRPGAGKTRIATEIARARTRRELLEDSRLETRADRRRLERGAWLRFAWPFSRRREATSSGARDDAPWYGADPWDAGWLIATLEPGSIPHGRRSCFDDALLARLRVWRPRRPTVLVLDDPRPGDAGGVIGALLTGELRYRHPVRLIVVNQTLPQELGLESRSGDGWSAGPRGFAGVVLALDAAAPLSAGEVRRMFGALRFSGHIPQWKPTVDALASAFAGDHDFEVARAKAWRFVTYARAHQKEVGSCENAAQQVDALARPFAGDRDFELERIQAWRAVVAASQDVQHLESAARHVDTLADPFAGERDFELVRVQAWASVALRRTDVVSCERAAEHIQNLGRPFGRDRDFEFERIKAWCHVAYARQNDAASCERAARYVDALARPFALAHDFEFQRAKAWVAVAYARRDDVAGCENAAERVDALGRPFVSARDFEHQRAAAWRYVAWARRSDVASCESAARHVDDLCRPFAGARDFELNRIQAWRYVAYAHRNNVASCWTAVQHVDTLARQFAGDRAFEFERTEAWSYIEDAGRTHIAGRETAARYILNPVPPHPS